MPTADFFLALFQFVVTLLAIVVQWRSSAKDTRTWPLFAVRVVAIFGAGALAWTSFHRAAEQGRIAADLREVLQTQSTTLEAQNTQLTEQSKMLSQIGALHGDRELLEKYLAINRQRNLGASEVDAQEFAKKLVATLPERQTERVDRLKQADRLVGQLRVQIEPIGDFLIAQFDARVDALINQKLNVSYTNKIDSPPGAATTPANIQVRAVSITTVQLFVDIWASRVFETGDASDAYLRITLDDRQVLNLRISKVSAVLNDGDAFCSFPGFTAKLDDPKDNVALEKAIGRALDEIFTVAVVRASPSRADSPHP